MKAKGSVTVVGVCLLLALASSGALAVNLIVNGTFSGGWPAGIDGTVISAPYAHGVPSVLGWGPPIGDNYVSAPDAAVVSNGNDLGPGEGELFVVVAVDPDTTYDLSLWLYTTGPNFDGAGGADHWSKPFYAIDQTTGGLFWQPATPFATVESQIGWTQFSTQVTIPLSWTTGYLKLGVWSRFAAGSTMFNPPTYPRAQTDDWVVEGFNPNLISGGGFEAGISPWVANTVSGGGNAWLSVDPVNHPGWSLTDSHGGSVYLAEGAQPAPGKVEVYQDVAVEGDTTYSLSAFAKAVGPGFDGPGGEDQGLVMSVAQAQGGVWGGPSINLSALGDQTDWQEMGGLFRTAADTDTVRVKFTTTMAIDSFFDVLAGRNHAGLDDVAISSFTEVGSNLLGNPGFDTGDFTGGWNGTVLSGNYGNAHPNQTGWGSPIGDNYESAPWSAVTYVGNDSPAEGTLLQDVSVLPGMTYRLSMWVFTQGPGFDGAGGADHWTKPYYKIAQTTGGLAWDPPVPFATVESKIGWTKFATEVAIPSGWSAGYLRLGLWSKFSANSSIYRPADNYPRVQTDTWKVVRVSSTGNLVSNDGFEGGTLGAWTGSTLSGDGVYGTYPGLASVWDPIVGPAAEGSKCGVLAAHNLGNNSAGGSASLSQTMAATGSTTYSISAQVRTVGSGFDGPGGADQHVDVIIDEHNPGGWTGPSTTIATMDSEAIGWTYVSGSVTTQAATDMIRIRCVLATTEELITNLYPRIGIDDVKLKRSSQQLEIPSSIGAAKKLGDGVLFSLVGPVVTARYATPGLYYSYIEDPDRANGIRLNDNTDYVYAGNQLYVLGTLSTDPLTGSRLITPSKPVQVTGNTTVPAPLGLRSDAVIPRVLAGSRIDTEGMLVTVWGVVRATDYMSWMDIDDGNGQLIRVENVTIPSGPPTVQEDVYVSATGIAVAGYDLVSGDIYKSVIGRGMPDEVVVHYSPYPW